MTVSDGIDTAEGENELAPIRNLFNKWYTRDIGKKRRISNKMKGNAVNKYKKGHSRQLRPFRNCRIKRKWPYSISNAIRPLSLCHLLNLDAGSIMHHSAC